MYLPLNNIETPDRLQENIDSGYAVELNWSDLNTNSLISAIEKAIQIRYRKGNLKKVGGSIKDINSRRILGIKLN